MSWFTLPLAGERLESVVHHGNGKRSELRLAFTSGRRLTLPVHAVRVEADGGVVVDVSSPDDLSLHIEYRGTDLIFSDGRFGSNGADGDFDSYFAAEADSWLASGCAGEFTCVVRIELHLTSPVTAAERR